MKKGISVIICCYNSAARLPETLKHLAKQKSLGLNWELIVVDNNSSDDTSEVARQEWNNLDNPVPLVVVVEPQPGLSNARATGVREARYEFLLFCDDDNWLESDYLKLANQLMQADLQIGILGGLNTAVSTVALPTWFKTFEQAYACGPQAEKDGEVAVSRLYITGAGMVLRRQVLNDLAYIGFVSNLTDRKGEELSSGGDTELCFVTAMLGYKLVYSSRLRLFHFMEPKRLEWNYLLKLAKGHAKSYHKLTYYKRICEGDLVSRSWISEMVKWQKLVFSREGLLMVYHVFLKRKQAVGDEFHIHMRDKYESLRAFYSMKYNYSSFINKLYSFNKAAKDLVAQRNIE